MCQFLFCKFARLNIRFPLGSSVYQLYRVSLLQFEVKVDQAMREQCARYTERAYYQQFDMTLEHVRAVPSLGAHFAPIANLVNAIEVIKAFGTSYLPRLQSSMVEGTFVPTIVSFSTLRTIVSKLADVNTPIDQRRYFQNHSALPGAVWGAATEVLPDGTIRDISNTRPILLNPDNFISANYSVEDLHSGITGVEDLLEIVGRKYPKYVYAGPLDFGGNGNMLTTCEQQR